MRSTQEKIMLKLTRKNQQAVVVHPRGNPDNALVMRVVDIVPNAVLMGFDGGDYEIHRSEVFSKRRNKSNDVKHNK